MMFFLVHADAGINGSSERIVAVLVRSDTAVALNVTVGSVQVLAVQQIGTRQLLINVSATVPMPAEQEAVAAVRDLSAGELSLQHMCVDQGCMGKALTSAGGHGLLVLG